MGLCSIKIFSSRRHSEELLRAAILTRDVTSIHKWTQEYGRSTPLDIVIGEKGEPPVLYTTIQACSEEGHRTEGFRTIAALLKLGFSASACSQDAVALSPCYTAARHNRADILRLLITSGGDPRAQTLQGQTPIIMAAALGHTECVRVLLESGINPNTVTTAINGTALHLAAPSGQRCSFEVCEMLLKHGADINQTNNPGRSPLHCVCETRRDLTGMVRFLLSNGAHINVQDAKGYTPLMRSMMVGNTTTAEYLVECGANANLRDNSGKTAREIGETKRGVTKEDLERVFAKQTQPGGLRHL